MDSLFKYGDYFKTVAMDLDPDSFGRVLPAADDTIWGQVWDLLLRP